MQVGNVVLLQEDNLILTKWPLGRIINIRPGKDGFVRIVTVKTSNGTYKRPITKIALSNELITSLGHRSLFIAFVFYITLSLKTIWSWLAVCLIIVCVSCTMYFNSSVCIIRVSK